MSQFFDTLLSLSGGVFAEIYFTRPNSLFALLETLFMILDDAYRTSTSETDTRHFEKLRVWTSALKTATSD